MRPSRDRLSFPPFLLLILACWTLGAVPAAPAIQAGESETPSETASPLATETFPPSETELPPTDTPTSTPTTAFPPAENLGEGYTLDELVVGLYPPSTAESIQACLQAIGGSVASRIEELNALVIRVPFGMVANAISGLRQCPGVEYAEPNYLVHVADVTPNDPFYLSDQYGLRRIHAPAGWGYTTGSAAVVIAIVDTGIDLDHPDLAAKIVPGWDFVNGDGFADDDHGHGTHVAGIAAASSNNGTGVSGVSWGAHLMPVKALNAAGSGTFANLANGILWATDHGAQVINLSVGSINESDLVKDALDDAYAHGVVVVAAAGNTWGGAVLFPANYGHVIAVSATDGNDALASFSAIGPQVDLAAPGDNIYSTSAFGLYMDRDGTSQAAAYVSGLAAILRGLPGSGSVDNIAWLMESTALDLGPAGADDMYGAGLIQMDAALRIFFPTPVPPTATSIFYPPVSSRTPTLTRTVSPSATLTATGNAESPTPATAPSATPSAIRPSTGGGGETEPSPTPERGAPPTIEYPLLFCYGSGLFLIGGGILFLILRRRSRHSTNHWQMETRR